VIEEPDGDEKNMLDSSNEDDEEEEDDDMQDWMSALDCIKERAIGRTMVSVGDDLVIEEPDGDEKNMLDSSNEDDEEEEDDDMQDWMSALDCIKERASGRDVSTDVKMEQEQKKFRKDEFDDDDVSDNSP
jgi:hypothetical protein